MDKIKAIFLRLLGRNKYDILCRKFNFHYPKINYTINNIYRFRSDEVAKQLILGVFYAYSSLVDGDIAEFGTAYGTTAKAISMGMAAAERDIAGFPKKLYLFDSFEGLPESTSVIDKELPSVKSNIWGKGACKGLNKHQLEDVCKKHISENKIIISDGLFYETINKLRNNILFSMIHFDGDLYSSTMDVFDTCFKKGFISNGAIIFFDDWNSNLANPEWGERKAWYELVKKYSINYSDEGSYALSSHVFIIHSYQRG